MALPFSKFIGPDGTAYEVKDADARDKKLDKTDGDASDTKVSKFAELEDAFPSPAEGDTTKTLWGKVKKFVDDFKTWNKGVLLLGQLVNDTATNNAQLPVSAAVAYDLQQQINVQNTNLVNVNNKFSYFSFENSSNIDSYNENLPYNAYRILYGLIDNVAYVSIDVSWIRIQFKADPINLFTRTIYGDNPPSEWSAL